MILFATILFYVTLMLELTIWHVPSVASTRGILKAPEDIKNQYSDRFRWVFEAKLWVKLILFTLPLVLVYLLYLYPILTLWEWYIGELKLFFWQELFAAMLILIGRLFGLTYLFKIRQNNTQKDDNFKLHTTGLFHFSRNPGLTSLYLSFVGFGVVKWNGVFLFCFMVYVCHMHFKVLMEEDFLKNKFGLQYLEYLRNSKRYI